MRRGSESQAAGSSLRSLVDSERVELILGRQITALKSQSTTFSTLTISHEAALEEITKLRTELATVQNSTSSISDEKEKIVAEAKKEALIAFRAAFEKDKADSAVRRLVVSCSSMLIMISRRIKSNDLEIDSPRRRRSFKRRSLNLLSPSASLTLHLDD